MKSEPTSWDGACEEDEDPAPWYIDAHNVTLQPATAQHAFTLVLLHSCSGGPDDWIPFFHRLDAAFRGRVRAVIPCSPIRREEHFGWTGEQNSWFEYSDIDGSVKYPAQLLEQRARVLQILEREQARLPGADPRRLVLGGLSQGVSLAVDVALRHTSVVGGVLALRGSALRESLQGLPAARQDTRSLEVLAYHGARDNQCPPEEAGATYEALRPHGVNVRFEVDRELGHACARGRQRLCGREFRRLNDFLLEIWGTL